MRQLYVLLVGTYFGIVLVKSEVVSWFRINKMFQFQEAQMYLIIASAVVVGMISVFLLKRLHARTVFGETILPQAKPYQKGIIIGGTLFGMGWAITGACPGPIYAQIGGGNPLAIITFLGALGGMFLYAVLQSRLPH